MGFTLRNGAYSTLAAGATSAATSITVATGDGAKFGSPTTTDPVRCVIEDASTTPPTVKEIIDVTGVATDTLTIVRAVEDATRFPNGALTSGWYVAAVETIATLAALTANTQSGTTYTLVASDAGLVIRCTNASAVTVTVPPNSSVAYPIGTVINVYAAGAGGVTIAAGVGVTIRNNAVASVQYREVSLRKDGTDEWVRLG